MAQFNTVTGLGASPDTANDSSGDASFADVISDFVNTHSDTEDTEDVEDVEDVATDDVPTPKKKKSSPPAQQDDEKSEDDAEDDDEDVEYETSDEDKEDDDDEEPSDDDSDSPEDILAKTKESEDIHEFVKANFQGANRKLRGAFTHTAKTLNQLEKDLDEVGGIENAKDASEFFRAFWKEDFADQHERVNYAHRMWDTIASVNPSLMNLLKETAFFAYVDDKEHGHENLQTLLTRRYDSDDITPELVDDLVKAVLNGSMTEEDINEYRFGSLDDEERDEAISLRKEIKAQREQLRAEALKMQQRELERTMASTTESLSKDWDTAKQKTLSAYNLVVDKKDSPELVKRKELVLAGMQRKFDEVIGEMPEAVRLSQLLHAGKVNSSEFTFLRKKVLQISSATLIGLCRENADIIEDIVTKQSPTQRKAKSARPQPTTKVSKPSKSKNTKSKQDFDNVEEQFRNEQKELAKQFDELFS